MHDRYSGHATTFEAAVHGFGSVQELRKIRKEVKAKFPPAQVRGAYVCLPFSYIFRALDVWFPLLLHNGTGALG